MPAKIKYYCSFKNVKRANSYIVYDMSIENMEERHAKAMNFSTGTKVADYLGLDIKSPRLERYTTPIIVDGKMEYPKCESKKHNNKLFSIRKVKNTSK